MRLRPPTECLAVAAACAGADLLCRALYPPLGEAAVVLPSVGVGFGAVLALGRRALVGVGLGHALSAVCLALGAATPPGPELLGQAAVVGLVMAAQAGFGAWLARKLLGPDPALVKSPPIAAFLLVAGPLHTLPTTLVLAGMIDGLGLGPALEGGWVGHALDWWRANALGGLLLAPASYALVARPAALWGPRRRMVAGSAVLGLAACVVGTSLAYRGEAGAVRWQAERDLQTLERVVATNARRAEDYGLALARAPGAAWGTPELGRSMFWAHRPPSVRWAACVRAGAPGPGGGLELLGALGPPPGWAPDAGWRELTERARQGGGLASEFAPRALRLAVPCREGAGREFVLVELDPNAFWADMPARDWLELSVAPPGAAAPDAGPGGLVVGRQVGIGGRRLALWGVAGADQVREARPRYSDAAGAGGVAVAVALAALALAATGRGALIGEVVATRTAELRREVEARARAEKHLRDGESRLLEAQRLARLGHWELDPATGVMDWSAVLLEMLGCAGSDRRFELDDFLVRLHPGDRAGVRAAVECAAAGRRPTPLEFRAVTPAGLRWLSATVAPTAIGRGAEESGRRVRGTVLDLTERKTEELAAREGRARLRLALHSARMGTWEWDVATGGIVWDERQFELFGVPPGGFDARSETFFALVHPDDREAVGASARAATDGDAPFRAQFRVVHPGTGAVRWLEGYGQLLGAGPRGPGRMVGVNFDITERKTAELALSEAETRQRLALDAGGMGTLVWSLGGARVSFDARLAALLGPGGAGGPLGVAEFLDLVAEPDRERVYALLSGAVFAPAGYDCACEFRPARPAGARWLAGRGRVFRDGTTPGAPGRLFMTFYDATARVEAEETLRAGEARLAEAQRIARMGSWEIDLDTGEFWASAQGYAQLGLDPADRPSAPAVLALAPPECRARLEAALAEASSTGGPVELEHRMRHAATGEVLRMLTRAVAAPPVETGAGARRRVLGTSRDVTAERQLEDEKREFHERMQETQKLESLGVLAGGVAHDFNNLLTGVLGNAGLAREFVGPESPLHEFLKPIEKSAQHAAQLCQQMLAYAGRGDTVAGPLSLNRLIEDSHDLLRLAVPRRAGLTVTLARKLPHLTGDAPRLRQVLLNLVQNAGEAIPNSGAGTVEVRTGVAGHTDRGAHELVCPGPHPEGPCVYAEVIDDGAGMDEATRLRVFEPFFTTKFTGRGLGLSAVHGIAKSHGGTVCVLSAPGAGTTFRVTLPCEPIDSPLDTATVRNTPRPLPRDETKRRVALVVDDDELIRNLVGLALKALGCEVAGVGTATEGIEAFRADPDLYEFALIDHSLPDAEGREVVEAIRQRRAAMPVILMSGFGEEVIGGLALDPAAQFLAKPFRSADLAAAVRRMRAG